MSCAMLFYGGYVVQIESDKIILRNQLECGKIFLFQLKLNTFSKSLNVIERKMLNTFRASTFPEQIDSC